MQTIAEVLEGVEAKEGGLREGMFFRDGSDYAWDLQKSLTSGRWLLECRIGIRDSRIEDIHFPFTSIKDLTFVKLA